MLRAPIVLLVLAAVTALTACGGDTGGTTSSATLVGGTPGSDEVQKDASGILTDASMSMQSLLSMHVNFTGTETIGNVRLSLDIDNEQRATGTMTVNGTLSEIVVSGDTLYVQERALAQILMGQPIDPSYDGKWIELPISYGIIIDTLRTANLLSSCIGSYADHVTKRPEAKIDGQKVIPLYSVDSSQDRSVFYVALDGSAHLVHWTIQSNPNPPADCTGGIDQSSLVSGGNTSGPVGDYTWSAFNKPVNVLIPSTGTQGPTAVPTPTF